MVMEVTAPWNKVAGDSNSGSSYYNPNGTLDMFWYNRATVPAPCDSGYQVTICEYFASDKTRCYLERKDLTCSGAPYNFGTYSFRAQVCGGERPCGLPPGGCGKWVDSNNLAFVVTKSKLGCPVPRKNDCKQCEARISTGGCSACVGGEGAMCKVEGAGAHLYYAAGGAGSNATFPGTASWTPILGRNWSHDYAQRIILDPDDSHVWLITNTATFREWSGLSGGIYGTVSPSNEKRTLRRTASGWDLVELDGTVHTFNTSGLWTRTADKNGNAKTATYNASNQLASVSFPDGRSESFTYHPSGKLASITEIGVGGSPTRTWSYTWSGDDLTRVDRPDGTAWEFFYHATLPGALIRRDLVGTDLTRRVEGAWDYDTRGNVIKAWRGDPVSTGSNAVDVYTFSYNDPVLPTQTQVTDPLGKVTTYAIARDTVSDVPKITQINGDCPVCGTGPNAQFTYGDPANPLLPTEVIDGRGLRTQYAYDAKGQMTSKTEAVGTPLARTTIYQYGNASFPAFPTRIEMPSTSGGAAQRVTVLSYNTTTGDLTTRTIQGAEAGSSFSFSTVSTFNGAGQPLTIDPSGFGTADQTTYTYDPVRGNLFPLTRTDPLIGATNFAYDAFNRRTSVIDPNGVETVTTYDNLNRVTSMTQKGATASEDLTTAYQYNVFGDLLRTTLPRGNVIEYGYDPAGRLISIERKPDAATHGERTFYTLDAFGHRTKEELQRWNGTAWVTESFTDFVYSTRCHLDKTINADGAVTEYAYDCDGNLEKVWDANHPKATNPNPTQLYAYDFLNRLSSLTQPWTGVGGTMAVTSYTYDVQDHLTGVTDAEANATTYTYSDRDLMTQEVSPVSGTSTSSYNEHGELVSQTDARGITVTRTVDALDRVTLADYPDNTLDTTYTYDDPAVSFSKGRLTKIARSGSQVAYAYDRFGRVTQDGALSYQYDKNGNRTQITYPGGVSAIYTHDFADREATLSYDAGAGSQPLVTASAYKPFGPLTSLSFANGLAETRLFDNRYRPDRIQAGSLLDWDYTEDAVGNPTQITGTVLSKPYTATFAYQDNLYFLTQGNGPWGARSWTYDRIGNRLTNQETGEASQTYTYAGSGHNPKLTQITPAPGLGTGSLQFAYDAAGNQTSLQETDGEGAVETTLLDVSQESRLAALRPTTAPGRTDMLYDGRGFLRQANQTFTGSPEFVKVTPVYSSEGLLMARTEERAWSGSTLGPDGEDSVFLASDQETTQLFYFAGRPVAQRATGPELLYLTTDHLGTPVLATDSAQNVLWAGGLEPFGRVWSAGDNPDPEPSSFSLSRGKALVKLSAEKVFLRYPGQWASDAVRVGGVRLDLFYNVHRWYEPSSGRYTRTDPVFLAGYSPYVYGLSDPINIQDPLGLLPEGTSDETTCLVCTVYSEARGTSRPCQHAVASVILNRLARCRGYGIPTTVCDVVSAAGQFQGYGNSNYNFCRDCKLPMDELGDTWRYFQDPFPVTPGIYFGNNTPSIIRYFRGLGESPVANPSCRTFVFFGIRDPFVQPPRRLPYCG
jgi:RHS repeat-associated protein